MDGIRGSSPTKNSTGTDPPEQLLDAFKAAALSVTKLYKTSAAAQTKARSYGYQDCLDDLLAFLDKQNIGLSDGEGWQIRRWATERLDGRDGILQTVESEDEGDKNDAASSPELHQPSTHSQLSAVRNESEARTESAPPPTTQHTGLTSSTPLPQIVVPTRDNFTFQSSMTYPQDSDLDIANLDLSDSRANDTTSATSPQHHVAPHPIRPRINRGGQRPRHTNHLGRGVGQKRKLNIDEIFDLSSLGGGKDMFGSNGGGKRSRHT